MDFLAKRVRGTSIWSDALRRLLRDPWAVFSFVVIVIYVGVALGVFAGLIDTQFQNSIGNSREAPSFLKGWRFWLGLDFVGRSIVCKIIEGTATAMEVGLMTSVIAIPIGVFLGAVAGYFGGIIDDVVTWLYTTVSNIPDFLLIVAIAFSLDKGIFAVNLALGMTSWVSLCRLIRGEFMKHKNREYVHAAAAIGGSHARRIFKHILPNVLHIVIINFSTRFVLAIKSEVILTYLGLGAQAGTASWGLIIDDAKGELVQGIWWGLAGVTVAMFFICLAFSLFSDALRDAFDPKLRT